MFLTILKISGIAVLSILGIIVLTLLLLLFVPIRYRAKGVAAENTLQMEGKISWLLHFVAASFEIAKTQKMHIKLKVLGITIFDNLKPKNGVRKKKEKIKKEPLQEKHEIVSAEIDNETEKDVEIDNIENDENVTENNIVIDDLKTVEDKNDDEILEKVTDKKQSKHIKNSVFTKIRIFFEKIVHFIKNIKYTFTKMCDTIKDIRDNINSYLVFLRKESTKNAIMKCKEQLFIIMKMLMPRKFSLNLHIGFEDPMITGEIMAFLGMLYPLHQGNVNVLPEFEHSGKPILEGDLSFKGRITLFIILKAGLIFLFDKDIKQTIKVLRNRK